MFNLKLNSFTDEELSETLKMFKYWRDRLEYQCERSLDCPTCPVRHLCYAVDRSIAYLHKAIKQHEDAESEGSLI